ncbi:MAG: phenylalanine--tRNA ligase beta subunit-related protein [Caryophanon sp.]|nr:phenylalanine--tRNA ligase beta subunit-related protein [Caryophanon sp.]
MNISIHSTISHIIPNVQIGVIAYKNITISDSPQMIKGRTQLYQENLFLEMQDAPVTTRPGIAEWRTLWKTLGGDSNRYRHSAESLLRRVAKANYVTPVNSGVDLNNFFSMNYEIPIGLYDAAKLEGDITVVLGTADDKYEALNGRTVTLTHIMHTKDARSSFGSPYVDSARTAVTEQTTDALHIFYLRPSLSVEENTKLLHAAGNMFTQINGGTYDAHIITA